MPTAQPYHNFKSMAAMMGPAKETQASGFMDNFQASVGMTVLNDLSISGMFWDDYSEKRRKTVHSLIESGMVSNDEVQQFTGTRNDFDTELNYNLLAQYLQSERGIDDVETDEQISERNGVQKRALLGHGLDVTDRADAFGVMGQFAGTLVGYSLDPFMWASVTLPTAYASRATSLLARAAVSAGKAGLTEGTLELARQPLIYQWRTEMGQDYSMDEGFSMVAMAVLGAGAIGGAAPLVRGGGRATLDATKITSRQMRDGLRDFLNGTRRAGASMEEIAARENLEDFDSLLAKLSEDDPDSIAIMRLKEYQEEVNRINRGAPPPLLPDPNAPKVAPAPVRPEGATAVPEPLVARSVPVVAPQYVARKLSDPYTQIPKGPLDIIPTRVDPVVPAGGGAAGKVIPLAKQGDELIKAPAKTDVARLQGVTFFDEMEIGDVGAIDMVVKPLKEAVAEMEETTGKFVETWRCLQNVQGA